MRLNEQQFNEAVEYLTEWSLFKKKNKKQSNSNNEAMRKKEEEYKEKYNNLINSVPDVDENKVNRKISHNELRIIRDIYMTYMLSDMNVDAFKKLYLNANIVNHGKWILIKDTNQILDKEDDELIDSDEERFHYYR